MIQEDQWQGLWYGRVLERIVVDPQLLTVSRYWQNEWHPPRTVEARELLWLQKNIPTAGEVLSGISWFRTRFGATPTVVYCDSSQRPNKFQGIDIYGPVQAMDGSLRGIDEIAPQIGLTRR